MRRTVLLAFVLLLATLAPQAAAMRDPDPGVSNWAEAHYNVTFSSLDHANLTGTLAFHKLRYQGSSYSAQSARNLYHQMAASDPAQAHAFLQNVEASITNRVQTVLATTIPGGANATVAPTRVEWASLNATSGSDPYRPPIVFDVAASIPVDTASAFGNADPGLVAALFSLGATVPVPVNLTAYAGTNATYTLSPPDPLAFGPSGNVTRTIPNWDSTSAAARPVTLQVQNPAAPSYSTPDIRLNVTVDVQGLQLDLLGAPSGNLGTLRGDFNLKADLLVVPVPPGAAARIPPQVHVTDVSAGQVRMLLEKGVINRSELNAYSGAILNPLRNVLTGQLGAPVTGSFDPTTLVGPTGLGPEPPIVFRATSHVAYPLQVGAASGTQASMTFFDIQRTVSVPPLQGYDTNYTIILPQGVALLGAHVVSGPGSVAITTVGGHPALFVDAPAGGDTRVALHAAATPLLILTQAWQLVLLALLIILVPLALIVWRRRRRRRRAKAAAAPEVAGEAEP